jgi:hypothetical protein
MWSGKEVIIDEQPSKKWVDIVLLHVQPCKNVVLQ